VRRKGDMERRIWIGIGILAVVLLILFIFLYRPAPTREQLLKKFEEFEGKSQEMKEMGYNVTEAEELARIAREFFNKKDYRRAEEKLDKAFDALEKLKIIIPEEIKESARKKLSEIEVAIQYRYVTDGGVINRSLDDVIRILKELRTDFIYQGWMRQEPCPEKCSDLPKEDAEKCELKGYSYEHLRSAVAAIKKEMPDVIFGGGLLAEFLNPECWNPITGEKYSKDDTWNMALDPSKWGIQMTKEEFQTEWAISRGWVKRGEPYNPKEQMPYYYPDITNREFRELFLSWAKKQIDCGVDAIWIDMLFVQPELLKRITKDENHPAVKESFEAASSIVDEIHSYGWSKGKYIYVISWPTSINFAYPQPDLDAVVVSPSPEEIREMRLNEQKWDERIKQIRENLPNATIFARIDYGSDNSPLWVLTQELNKEEQRDFLRYASKFYEERGVKFIYPVHGGNLGVKNIKIRSYGRFNWYDSFAPEFDVYGTIKQLISKMRKG